MRRLLGMAIPCAVACSNPTTSPAPQATSSVQTMTTTSDEAKLVADLSAALPPGCRVERVARDVAPVEWFTHDGPGLYVEGSGPDGKFQIWFVPEGWVGIRKFAPKRARLTYWEGLLLGRGYKSLTIGPVAVQEAVRKLEMQTSSLVNSGWRDAERIWSGRFSDAEKKAEALIDEHAKDAAPFSEAVHSLIVLGVPARSVFVRAATEASGDGRELALSALGYFSGPEVTAALGKAVIDPTCEGRCRKLAAMSLEQVGDAAAGPALASALPKTTDTEAATRIALALARVRYREASSAILGRMGQEESVHYKALYAQALAALQHKPATGAIEALAKRKTFNAEWALEVRGRTVAERDPGISLLRLTGPWSRPVDGIRILILAPEAAEGELAILIENNSDAMIMVPELLEGTVFVDGSAHQRQPMGWDGVAGLNVGGVWIHPLRLAEFHAKNSGTVYYVVGKLRSNSVVL